MTKKLPALLIALALCAACPISSAAVLRGDMGFADARGGEGGAVIRVTNLDAKGPGSLRAALEAKGPRIVVFEVGGVIDLDGAGLGISEPFITVAGQTAPEPGITIIKGGIGISTHHVLIQHIRVRPGDAGKAKRSGWEPDGISTSGGNAHDVVIDHCSVTWAVDENLSASGARTEGPEATSHRITFSNCIIAEGLNDSSHTKGPHSKGSLIHDNATDIAIYGNLYAHNDLRNPYFKAFTTGVVVNNLIYNPRRSAIKLNYVPAEWKGTGITPENARIAAIGNVFHQGVDTVRAVPLVGTRGDAYLEDNLAFHSDGSPARITGGRVIELEKKPVWPEALSPMPAGDVAEYVVKHAGARPRQRDAIDARIIREFRQRKGRIIDSQDEVGGYPAPEPVSRPLDVPETDVQAWLAKLAAEVE